MAMSEKRTYTLEELASATGVEPRTIRSYIERGILPGAQARGRAAGYGEEHLRRLRVIHMIRRADRSLSLAQVRVRLHQLTEADMDSLAHGVLSASAVEPGDGHGADQGGEVDDETEAGSSARALIGLSIERSSHDLAGAERLVLALRQLTRAATRPPTSRIEGWLRITVTEDIEFSVRAGFSEIQIGAFREFADLLRDLLTRPDAIDAIGT
jgi:DNA-binding transcriptional MerR regulator